MIDRAPFLTRPVHLLLFALLLCTTLPSAQAQTRGAIGGTVTDQAGMILQGAEISMQTPTLTVSTNEEGRFYINDLAPGTYKLTVTYVGLAPFTTSVTVNAGQTANVNAQLQIATRGETVVVTAARASAEAEAINIERSADNLLQVMPSEVITSLPNANLADALGRMPSVTLERDEGEGKYVHVRSTESRLTNTTVDGVNLPSQEHWTVSGNGANRHSVSFGNANLKAETGDDVDVLFDHYLKRFGIISVGYFYKSLQNPIVTSTYQLTNHLPPLAQAVSLVFAPKM